jgi:hypothetical protein
MDRAHFSEIAEKSKIWALAIKNILRLATKNDLQII